jgi:hypothetical protein
MNSLLFISLCALATHTVAQQCSLLTETGLKALSKEFEYDAVKKLFVCLFVT